jgi:FlaA1/EpsC-like NDP-sugar epimerase
MDEILRLIGRDAELFREDLDRYDDEIRSVIRGARILVVGGAGSVGRAVVKELFKREPKVLHVVDISENNLAELVRDLRSSVGYIPGEFKTYCLDCGSVEFEAFFQAQGGYDYILNFSALKHVRDERDPFTLMRMIKVNIVNAEKLLSTAADRNVSKYFCVSTDKAANPVNMMGASKRIMEMFLMRAGERIPVSSARFANVAFSDGSLLDGFDHRLRKRQPFSAPKDVRRYFITEKESGVLCLLSAFLGNNRDVFFPKLSAKLHLRTFSRIAVDYLTRLGYDPYICESEEEARGRMAELYSKKKWPCYFFTSDTTGEKDFEEFYSEGETVEWDRFRDIGVIRMELDYDDDELDAFLEAIGRLTDRKRWEKRDLVELFDRMLDNFAHKETCKYLDDRM